MIEFVQMLAAGLKPGETVVLPLLVNIREPAPFIQRDMGFYRLAMDGVKRPVVGSSGTDCREALIEEQQFIEYEVGMPCWIQRLVETEFNTFSTECWV